MIHKKLWPWMTRREAGRGLAVWVPLPSLLLAVYWNYAIRGPSAQATTSPESENGAGPWRPKSFLCLSAPLFISWGDGKP